ncbi:MAG: peptide deformylase [Candidatus Hydrogenedentota bacterium]|nr:MAG: peptide deformylase [Candidatus Hydrogenedentota bacterium]
MPCRLVNLEGQFIRHLPHNQILKTPGEEKGKRKKAKSKREKGKGRRELRRGCSNLGTEASQPALPGACLAKFDLAQNLPCPPASRFFGTGFRFYERYNSAYPAACASRRGKEIGGGEIRRKICYLGETVLRRKAKEVRKVDRKIRSLVQDLFETMRAARGIGLAAPQVGVLKRLFVVEIPYQDAPPDRLAIINPRIVSRSREREAMEEGCLSIPGVTAEVVRPRSIVARGLDPEGAPIEVQAEGLFARCIQHELDHLDGILFIDRAGVEEREAREKMRKFLEERRAEKAAASAAAE